MFIGECMEKLERLERVLDGMNFKKNVPMRDYTTFKIGGECLAMVEPASAQEVMLALETAAEYGIDTFIMGNGSNLLVSDRGINKLVIRIAERMSSVEISGNTVMAQAGALLSSVAKLSVSRGLMGLEWASGIPGSIGGSVAMNAGAYGGELSDCVKRVDFIKNGRFYSDAVEKGDFGYRKSLYDSPDITVCGVGMELCPDNGGAAERMREYTALRRAKQPLAYPSAGSTFKRPEGYYAGALIEGAGLKGFSVGGAEVSTLHAGFIINKGGATADDVKDLIFEIQKRVFEKYGVMLETEIKYVGE